LADYYRAFRTISCAFSDKDDDPVQAVAVIEIENGPEAATAENDIPVVPVGFHSFWESVVRVEGPATTIVLAEDYAKSMGVFSPLAGAAAWIDNLYRITDRGSSFWNEFVGGMTTFFSIAYIMVVNPLIISGSYPLGKYTQKCLMLIKKLSFTLCCSC
jgi:hypothetical protein